MGRVGQLWLIFVVMIPVCGCVRPWIPNTEPTAVLVVTITERLGDTTLKQEFIPSRPFRVPLRPPLPRIVLPFAMVGGLTHAGTSLTYDDPPVVFTIVEDPFIGDATISEVPVSAPMENFAGMRESLLRYHPIERPPCMTLTAFFLEGVGDRPREPVVLTAAHGSDWGTTIVDPSRHTLRLEPVLRIRRRVLEPPVEAFVSIDVAAGGADFIILAVTRMQDSYRGMRVGSSQRGSGWQILPDDGETRLYVIDDRTELHGPCRRGAITSGVAGH